MQHLFTKTPTNTTQNSIIFMQKTPYFSGQNGEGRPLLSQLVDDLLVHIRYISLDIRLRHSSICVRSPPHLRSFGPAEDLEIQQDRSREHAFVRSTS